MKVDIKCNGLCQNTYFRIVETTPYRNATVNADGGNPALPIDKYYNKGKSLPPVWTDCGSDGGISRAQARQRATAGDYLCVQPCAWPLRKKLSIFRGINSRSGL